ncbi:hypothetical protein C8Q80DRAFT_1267633 [Daedaleopsis nitida]|nr:hypothetical protein C8Q80DRAFT_1267633 [Daedaleopsis nitida]
MTPPYFAIDESYLIGGWLESFFWGIFTLVFGMTMYSIYKKRRNGVNVVTTTSIVALYVLSTAHMSLALVRLIQGFIIYRETIGPVLYFANISTPQLVLGDLVVVWRLYVVWGKNLWVAVLPVIMTAGELVTGYGSISQWFLPNPVPETMVHWGTAMFVMSMATNIVVTVAIASRIWYVTRRTQKALRTSSNSTNDTYTRVALLIIESGSLIAAAKLTEFTVFQLAPVDGLNGLNAMYIVYEIMPQITGLVPTVIVYAVNNGYTQRDEQYKPGASTIVFGSAGTTADATDATSTVMSAHHGSGSLSLATVTFAPRESCKQAQIMQSRNNVSNGELAFPEKTGGLDYETV